MARDPGAAVERIRGRIDRRRDKREFDAVGRSVDDLYPIDGTWLSSLHVALGAPTTCQCDAEADALYDEIMASFAAKGLPERYAGWCDGGRAFTRAAWCLTVHLRPEAVVETGVARGVTSHFVLEALERAGIGRLWSIDLPSVDSRFHDQNAIAVPVRLKGRWTYIIGTSRTRLPPLLSGMDKIDFFIHDSLHTGANTSFEIERAWAALRPGGALLIDDVYQSLAFHRFVEQARPRWWGVGANPDGSYRFGIALKRDALDETLLEAARGLTRPTGFDSFDASR